MTDRLRVAAERVAERVPSEIRGPWLEWNAILIELVNQINLRDEETRSLLHRQSFANTAAIASGLREYAAGDEMARAAVEATIRAEIAALARLRAEDVERLRQELGQRHAELLAAIARISARQARRIARREE
jgi:hypothetical protein